MRRASSFFSTKTQPYPVSRDFALVENTQKHPLRLSNTLQSTGYRDWNPSTHKYNLGLLIAERAIIAYENLEVTRVARPYILDLKHRHDETVNIAILDYDDVFLNVEMN